jgi:hypothetical protein
MRSSALTVLRQSMPSIACKTSGVRCCCGRSSGKRGARFAGSPVFGNTTRAKRLSFVATTRAPISPSQSWPKKVAPRRSSCATRRVTQATCCEYV